MAEVFMIYITRDHDKWKTRIAYNVSKIYVNFSFYSVGIDQFA
jgi:hypothetical protein